MAISKETESLGGRNGVPSWMQRVETFSVLYKDREEDRMKVKEKESKGEREKWNREKEIEREREGKKEEEMNLDVLIQDGKTEWGEKDEGRKTR